MTMPRTKLRKEQKLLINFYLEKSTLQRCDAIVNQRDNVFEDRSTLIRYLIKQHLPILEAELKHQEEKGDEESD